MDSKYESQRIGGSLLATCRERRRFVGSSPGTSPLSLFLSGWPTRPPWDASRVTEPSPIFLFSRPFRTRSRLDNLLLTSQPGDVVGIAPHGIQWKATLVFEARDFPGVRCLFPVGCMTRFAFELQGNPVLTVPPRSTGARQARELNCPGKTIQIVSL